MSGMGESGGYGGARDKLPAVRSHPPAFPNIVTAVAATAAAARTRRGRIVKGACETGPGVTATPSVGTRVAANTSAAVVRGSCIWSSTKQVDGQRVQKCTKVQADLLVGRPAKVKV